MSAIVLFIIVIVVLVVAHELGHFFAARAFGVRVTEFGIGYPPRAKKLFRWKETLFTLNWLPFGGFVKIFGEEDALPDAHSFSEQKLWKRLTIVAAGVVINFLLAALLYAASFSIGFLGRPGDFPGSVQVGPSVVLVENVVDQSPAARAGIQSGDIISSVAYGTETLPISNMDQLILYVRSHPNKDLTLDILRGKKNLTVHATPHDGVAGAATPSLGIELDEAAHVRLLFFRALWDGLTYAGAEFGMIVTSLIALIGGLLHGNSALLSQVSGPVGIAHFAGAAYAFGIGSFLSFVALISVNLSVINMLPLPALDGGRLILECFSSHGRSRIGKRTVALVNQLGFLLLIALMVYVTYKDIVRLAT